MPNDLTKLGPYVEQARLTLTETAERERALVQALSDELKRFDQQTLQGVRTIAAEHEARRVGILDELQSLAASIGTFQLAREAPAVPQQTSTRQFPANPTFHDELERNLRALADERSQH